MASILFLSALNKQTLDRNSEKTSAARHFRFCVFNASLGPRNAQRVHEAQSADKLR